MMRTLTPQELATVNELLRIDFPGRDALSRQLDGALVETIDAQGSLRFQVGPVSHAGVAQRVPVHGQAVDLDGVTIQYLIHVADGRLHELEVFRDDSRPLLHQVEPHEIDVFVLSE
jgi:hypothetical protein